MTHLTETGVINASAESVWHYMDWKNVKNLIGGSFVAGCDFLNDIQGARSQRRLYLKDGSSVIEKCDAYNERGMTYDYSVPDVGNLPVRDYRGRVTLEAMEVVKCRLKFECFYTPVHSNNDPWLSIYPKFQQDLIEFIRTKVENK